jgi:hypothetical protein
VFTAEYTTDGLCLVPEEYLLGIGNLAGASLAINRGLVHDKSGPGDRKGRSLGDCVATTLAQAAIEQVQRSGILSGGQVTLAGAQVSLPRKIVNLAPNIESRLFF